MDWKEFFKPNRKIAFILILVQLAIALISIILSFVITDNMAKIILLGTLLGSIIPASYIAASLLLKPEKVLLYYAIIAAPLEVVTLFAYFLLDAIPQYPLYIQNTYFIFDSIFLSLVLFPLFEAIQLTPISP